jgi:hypothetical protein
MMRMTAIAELSSAFMNDIGIADHLDRIANDIEYHSSSHDFDYANATNATPDRYMNPSQDSTTRLGVDDCPTEDGCYVIDMTDETIKISPTNSEPYWLRPFYNSWVISVSNQKDFGNKVNILLVEQLIRADTIERSIDSHERFILDNVIIVLTDRKLDLLSDILFKTFEKFKNSPKRELRGAVDILGGFESLVRDVQRKKMSS